MPAFRRVEDRHASSTAVGILVPPGERTQVILRPRAVPWDLLPIRFIPGTGELGPICTYTRDEAVAVARRLTDVLDGCVQRGLPLFEVVRLSTKPLFGVITPAIEPCLVVCARSPGSRYDLQSFATVEQAGAAAEALAQYVQPQRDAEQEYYFNTQHFLR